MENIIRKERREQRKEELDYIIWGCLIDHIETYNEALKIARSLVRNGIRVVG
jgi:hypothetical protein